MGKKHVIKNMSRHEKNLSFIDIMMNSYQLLGISNLFGKQQQINR